MNRVCLAHRLAWRTLLGVVAAALAMRAASAAESTPPLSAFFANEDIREVRISPSGRHLALTVPSTTGRMALAVVEIGSDKRPVVVANSTRADVRSFEWVNDERLVYTIVDLQVAG